MILVNFKGRFTASDKMVQTELWATMASQGLVDTVQPDTVVRSPWYIQFMQSIAAWVASLFVLAFTVTFFGLFFDGLDTLFATLVGVVYNCAAIVIYRNNIGRRLFINQMALALSLCGLLSLAYGLTEWFDFDNGISWYLVFFSVLLMNWLIVEHYSHQFITSFGMIACAVGVSYELRLLEILPAVLSLGFTIIWLNDTKYAALLSRLNALGYMLAIWLVLIQLPLLLADTLLLQHSDFPILATWSNPLSIITTLIIAVALFANILRSLTTQLNCKQSVLCIFGLVLLALLSLPMTGLLTAVLILIVGFYVGERGIFILGILGVISFIAWYYYSLQLPLLDKSIWLIALGIGLLVVKVVSSKVFPATAIQEATSIENEADCQ
ncbi:DUF4401 domain-containing protein [Shewanella sp. 10N.261.52.F9]|uniref:DUF4401 domain-containing protein n=1 Tax=Shewanella sp. 10N.261.52.F9 TaxID=3229684 RepID=UPI00354B2FEA